jgi:hypothetical protein
LIGRSTIVIVPCNNYQEIGSCAIRISWQTQIHCYNCSKQLHRVSDLNHNFLIDRLMFTQSNLTLFNLSHLFWSSRPQQLLRPYNNCVKSKLFYNWTQWHTYEPFDRDQTLQSLILYFELKINKDYNKSKQSNLDRTYQICVIACNMTKHDLNCKLRKETLIKFWWRLTLL